jgi:hypothetical protein
MYTTFLKLIYLLKHCEELRGMDDMATVFYVGSLTCNPVVIPESSLSIIHVGSRVC